LSPIEQFLLREVSASNERVLRESKVSQDDLAGKLARQGVQLTQTRLSKIESKTRYVMDYEAQALARVLKVSVGWLFGRKNNPVSSAMSSQKRPNQFGTFVLESNIFC